MPPGVHDAAGDAARSWAEPASRYKHGSGLMNVLMGLMGLNRIIIINSDLFISR